MDDSERKLIEEARRKFSIPAGATVITGFDTPDGPRKVIAVVDGLYRTSYGYINPDGDWGPIQTICTLKPGP